MRLRISRPRLRSLLVIVLVGSLVWSLAVPPVALAGVDSSGSIVDADGDVEIDPNLEDTFEEAQKGETVEVVVQLEDASVSSVPEEEIDDVLEDHAADTHQPLLEVAESTDGVTVVSQFWVTNAVLLEVDAGTVELDVFETVESVERLHGNTEIPVPDRPRPPDDGGENETVSGYETTYGLAQIGAPAVWDDHGSTGADVTVAVLDTGIDVSHPDLDLYADDPADPTYPGGWAEFDERGERVDGSTPHDSHGHGTHVSGTIAGGDASGVHVGVAPDVDLVHGKVLDEDNGTYAQILAGMEWAVESDVDVLSMSFGATGTHDQLITPVRNVEASGVVPVAAIGNEGHGTSGSPANVYDAVAIGATDSDETVASFSGGEELSREDWSNPPADWPEEYVVPDLTAPGVGVYSTVPGGGYEYSSGTSMATPHVAGTVALVRSAEDELRPSDVATALSETADKPDDAPAEKDDRYGFGIIDAEAAVDAVASAPVDGDSRAVTDDEESVETDGSASSLEPTGTDGTPGFGVGVALVSLTSVILWRRR